MTRPVATLPEPAADGVLPVDKPAGPTSHDVVALARRALRTRRIGHTGTLDPFATGLLLLCVGQATRIAEYLSGMDKRYRATVRLGVTTDTDDDTGGVTAVADTAAVTRHGVEQALAPLRGAVLQTPPQYSAKKRDGERAYTAARQGRTVVLDPVAVHVHELTIVAFDPPRVELEVLCSSGTYIRAIARDLGAALGVGGHLTALRRTAIGPHTVDGALPLESLADEAAVQAALLPAIHALPHLPRIELGDEAAASVRHGRRVRVDAGAGAAPRADAGAHAEAHAGAHAEAHGGPRIVVMACGGALLGIGEVVDGVLHPRKVFL
jgi:tRNA pseudouridine55 synthase